MEPKNYLRSNGWKLLIDKKHKPTDSGSSASPKQISQEKYMPRHIIIFLKTKGEEKSKAFREALG